MKKVISSRTRTPKGSTTSNLLSYILTLILGLVLSGSGCNTDSVIVPDPINGTGVTINDITWATCNVEAKGTFAKQLHHYGAFYQWNRATPWLTSGAESGWDNLTPAGSAWSADNDPCPNGWRLPTKAELQSLIALSVIKEWEEKSGIKGLTIKQGANELFLPIVGYLNGDNGTLYGRPAYGGYWSSTQDSGTKAWLLDLYYSTKSAMVGADFKNIGASVRCVKK